MDIFLALLALVLIFLLYAAGQLLRMARTRSRQPARRGPDARTVNAAPGGEERRRLQWISADQFRHVAADSQDLLLVDLRPDPGDPPVALPADRVVRVRTHQLEDVLRSLPENRSAAFCGASGVCVFMIQTSSCMRGSAPLYLLEPDYPHAEVA